MNIELLKKNASTKNAGFKRKSTASTSRSTGKFFTNGKDSRRFWALIKISLQDASIIASYAQITNTTETKFSGHLLETYLMESDEKLASGTCEIFVRGNKFGGEKHSKTHRWMAVGISLAVLETVQELRTTSPKFIKLTDYQLMSELLRLALVDFQVSIEKDPAALNFSQEPTRTSPPEPPQESPASVLSSPATEIISLTESTELDAEPLLDGLEKEDLQQPVEPQASPEPTAEPKKASNFFKSGFAKKMAQKRAEAAANSSDTAAEVKTKRATVPL